MPQLKKQKISEQLLENLTAIKKLDIPVYIQNLKDTSKLNLSEQDIKKLEYVMKLSEHTFDYRVEDIHFILNLKYEEIKEIYDNTKKLGLK
jgi:rRNA maturation endonuclease Nob1